MKYARTVFLASFLALVWFFAVTPPVSAAASWTGGGTDRRASNPQNWLNGAVPVSGADLLFPAGSDAEWNLSGVVPASVAIEGFVSLGAPLIISGDFHMSGGKLATASQPLNIGGDFLMGGGELAAEGSPINVSGDWTRTGGVLSLSAATVAFNGSSDKTIISGGSPFGNLSVASIGKVTLADDAVINGTLSVSSGTLSAGGKSVVVMGGVNLIGGTLDIAGSELVLGGTSGRPLAVSGGTLLPGALSVVHYRSSSGLASVEPGAYWNLKFSGPSIYNLGGNVSVGGSLEIGSEATLSPSGRVLAVSGDFINKGNVSDGPIKFMSRSLRFLDSDGAPLASFASSSSKFFAEIEDGDLNRKGALSENAAAIFAVTTLGGDKEVFSAVETGAASGIFRSPAIVAHQGAPKEMNGQIEVAQDDIIFLKYADPQDPADSKTVQAAVSASSVSSSGNPQIVSGPRVTGWSSVNTGSGPSYSVHIVWQTDVLSSSSVSVTSPQRTAPIAAGSLAAVTDHDVAIDGLARGQTYSFTVSSVTAEGKSVKSAAKKFTVIVPGDRIKAASSSAVYWYLEGKRNVFPDLTSYDSWFPDWKGVVTVPAEQLADITLGKTIPVRASTYLVKIQSDPKTYAVEPYGRLRWVPTEEKARALYGEDWARRVRDVDVSQFVGYELGAPLGKDEVPAGFVYRIAGGEWNAVLADAGRALTDASRRLNGFSERFVSSVSPSAVSALRSASAIVGYEPGLNGVFMEGSKAVDAPFLSQ